MRKILLFVIVFGLMCPLFSIVPSYYGARSLSLGYAGSAFGYDVNLIHLNPSALSSVNYSLTGYQYQNSYLDYSGFSDTLEAILDYDLTRFESLSSLDKADVFSRLQDLYGSKAGMYGFSSSVPGFVSRGYGLSVALVNTAIINPLDPAAGGADLFALDPENVTNADIASLGMSFTGLSYKQMSLGYAIPLSRTMYVGITLNYLTGKVTEYTAAITDSLFSSGSGAKYYLETAWDAADQKFNKLTADAAVSMDIGRFFKVSLITKNLGSPKIKTPLREIVLDQRVIAALAFRPRVDWGIYLDMDIAKSDLLHNGSEMQPVALGIEKGFFNNSFFVRAGFLNDLTEKHFFGSKANALYGLGIGFNMKNYVIDVAIGVDSGGSVKNLAVSGFIIFR